MMARALQRGQGLMTKVGDQEHAERQGYRVLRDGVRGLKGVVGL